MKYAWIPPGSFLMGKPPGLEALKNMSWCSYDGEIRSSGRTKAVGQFQANDWGLFDMHENVYEWCQDWYGGYPF
jgi:formylglycine-generating enzyme required for sulfatase activity